MDPQIDPLTAFYLAMAQAGQYAGKPGSQLNSGDLSSFFSPNLGLLTGTLTDTSQSDEDIYASVAPNISRVRNNPDADPIATLIVENLESGFSLPQTLIELKKRVSGGDLKAYQEYAKEVSKEMGDVKSAFSKRKTPASEAGFPEPGAGYDPTPLMANIYSRLLKQAEPIAAPVEEKVPKKNEAGFKALANGPRRPATKAFAKVFGSVIPLMYRAAHAATAARRYVAAAACNAFLSILLLTMCPTSE